MQSTSQRLNVSIAGFIVLIGIISLPLTDSKEDVIYGYECQQNKCIKVERSTENLNATVSFPVCRMFCGDDLGNLWPKPTGLTHIEPSLQHIDYANIEFKFPNGTNATSHLHFWDENKARFMQILAAKISDFDTVKSGGSPLTIRVYINETNTNQTETQRITLDTDESYELNISIENADSNSTVIVNITAQNIFGARHGLETLSQLIIYDDILNEVKVVTNATIKDSPVFKWRGILLDTARHFYSVKSIKRTIDAMAMVKLNTFHWHITDTQSFPVEIKTQPDLYKLGAYSQREVYTHKNIADIVEYGRVRGIRVMPELDAPAHVGEGWQNKNMTVCFNAQPWKDHCAGPPCGQLDPTVDELYPILEDIYREMFELFHPDVFHMGGDEVAIGCWNSSDRIRDWMTTEKHWNLTESDFMRLWGHFQTSAVERVDRISAKKKIPITLWTSHLTDAPFIDEFLDPERYIIQIWTTGSDPVVKEILERGFRVIVSNYDALYFDCGGPSWVSEGNNWCSPYIGWQKVYDNNLTIIASGYESLVLGSEAALWSSQIDEFTVDNRLWPRAAALAERLWSNPQQNWRKAEDRLLYQRERMIENGIGAEAMQPQWCLLNQNECPVDAYLSTSKP